MNTKNMFFIKRSLMDRALIVGQLVDWFKRFIDNVLDSARRQ